jgi:ubiquinone/menaquinone biosynthesis C-methylase UbiE
MFCFKQLEKIIEREKKWKERYKELDKEIKPFLSESKKHLDFGCGFGCFAYLLSKDYPRMKTVGIDIDKRAIKEGRKSIKEKTLD